MAKTTLVQIGSLASKESGAFKIGPFGTLLKKTELVSYGIPVAGIENILPNRFEKGFRRFITAPKFKELLDYEIRPGDVLVTTMGTIGRAAVAPDGLGQAIIDSHLFRMRFDTGRVHPPYLSYALNSRFVAEQLSRTARGAIMDGLNTTILRECVVPFPGMDQQRRIASLLKQADRLRCTHRYALELSDTFLPAAFFELFGDTAFPKLTLDELVLAERGSFVNGPFGSDLLTSELVSDGVPVIYIRDISEGRYLRKSIVCVTPAKAEELAVCNVQPGDLLVAKVGDPPGVVAIYPQGEPVGVITQDVIRMKLNHNLVLPRYLQGLLNSAAGMRLLRPIIVEGTRKRFGLTPFKEVAVPVPPLPLQERFVELVARHERLRATQREALRQAEHLFQTLLHRAFSEGMQC